MSTLKDVKHRAAELGARVEDEKTSDTHSCRVEAPHRHLWAEGDVHELVDETNRPWKPDYADILGRMKYGVKPCMDLECEWCED